jgi:hypothetical protein
MQSAKCKHKHAMHAQERGARRGDFHPAARKNIVFAFCILNFEF